MKNKRDRHWLQRWQNSLKKTNAGLVRETARVQADPPKIEKKHPGETIALITREKALEWGESYKDNLVPPVLWLREIALLWGKRFIEDRRYLDESERPGYQIGNKIYKGPREKRYLEAKQKSDDLCVNLKTAIDELMDTAIRGDASKEEFEQIIEETANKALRGLDLQYEIMEETTKGKTEWYALTPQRYLDTKERIENSIRNKYRRILYRHELIKERYPEDFIEVYRWDQLNEIPELPGVYTIWYLEEMIYCGRTGNLQQRVRQHQKEVVLKYYSEVDDEYGIVYVVIPEGRVREQDELEKDIIEREKPIYNVYGKGL